MTIASKYVRGKETRKWKLLAKPELQVQTPYKKTAKSETVVELIVS